MAFRTSRSRSLRVGLHDVLAVLGLSEAVAAPYIESAVRFEEADGGRSISLADYFRVVRRVAEASGCETFNMSARPLLSGTSRLVYAQATDAKTLLEALRTIADTHNLLHGGPYNRVELRDECLEFVICDSGFPYADVNASQIPFVLEAILIKLHALVCEIVGYDASSRLMSVGTRRSGMTGPGARILDFWNVPVFYGRSEYTLAYDAGIATTPVSATYKACDHALAVQNRTLRLVESGGTGPSHGPVAECVRRQLSNGAATQVCVAKVLGMSVATLRRRLADERCDFHALRIEHLQAEACARLATSEDVESLAAELGFADERSFRRAFKTWVGVTPAVFRARLT